MKHFEPYILSTISINIDVVPLKEGRLGGKV